jgi:phage baseplate assembly protein W
MRNRDKVFQRRVTFNIINPIRNSTTDGVFDLSETSLDKYKSNLYTLIYTGLGERVMLPQFGTRIKYLLFEPMSETLFADIEKEIREKAAFWIPEISILSIEFPEKEENMENNKIDMKINFALNVDPDIKDFMEITLGV